MTYLLLTAHILTTGVLPFLARIAEFMGKRGIKLMHSPFFKMEVSGQPGWRDSMQDIDKFLPFMMITRHLYVPVSGSIVTR